MIRSVTRFRHSPAGTVAALIALLGSIPVAAVRWYLAPIALVPLAVAAWSWRAGTDADAEGVVVRALFASRRVPWTGIAGFTTAGRRVYASLAGGGMLALTAVPPAALPRLISASGQQLTEADPADSVPGQ